MCQDVDRDEDEYKSFGSSRTEFVKNEAII